MMPTLDQLPPSPTTARSDSHLAIIPPIPPKSKPFLPPKQKINKSKEDVDRVNKEKLHCCSFQPVKILAILVKIQELLLLIYFIFSLT